MKATIQRFRRLADTLSKTKTADAGMNELLLCAATAIRQLLNRVDSHAQPTAETPAAQARETVRLRSERAVAPEADPLWPVAEVPADVPG